MSDIDTSTGERNPLGNPVTTASSVSGVSFDVIVRTQGRRPGSLAEAMVSLGAQETECDFKVIVVVHGPPETAATVNAELEETDGLPKKWSVHGVGSAGGRARPLNVGLDMARGDYVVFLDDDDLAYPDWLSVFAQGAAVNPGEVIRTVTETQAWTTLGSEEPKAPTSDITRPYAEHFDVLAHLSHNETPICSMALPRRAVNRLGLRFDEGLDVLEDWDLLIRTALRLRVRSIGRATSLYRHLNAGSTSSSVEEQRWIRSREQVLAKLGAEPFLLSSDAVLQLN